MVYKDPYLTPIANDDSFEVPETITTDDIDTINSDISPSPATGSSLKYLVQTLAAVILLSFGWHIVNTLNELMQFNLIIGLVFSMLVGLLLVLLMKEVFVFLKGRKKIARLNKIRALAEQLKHEHNYGRSKEFLDLLQAHFLDTEHNQRLQNIIHSMPDYLSDQEILQHLDVEFFIYLDARTKKIIHDQSAKVAVMVALSPLASIDMLLATWRMTRMVNMISYHYGLTVSRFNRWQMIWQILKATALSGSSQLVVDQVIERVSLNTAGKAIAWATQGISVGIYAVRIGTVAARELRPIPATYESKQAITTVIDAVMKLVKHKPTEPH